MVVSINVTAFPDGDVAGHLAGVIDAAEAAGIDTVWVGDHLLQVAPGTSEDDPMLEAYTTLGFLAARSSARAARDDGRRRDVPRARAAPEGRPHARRALQRPRVARRRHRLQPARGGRHGPVPPARARALRDPRAGPAAAREQRLAPALASADPDRRHGRAPHAAPGGRVRRRLQPVRHPRRRPHRHPQAAASCASTARPSAAPTRRSPRRSPRVPTTPAGATASAPWESSTPSSSPTARGRRTRSPPWPESQLPSHAGNLTVWARRRCRSVALASPVRRP